MRKFTKGLAIILTASLVLSGIPAGRANAETVEKQQYATVTDADRTEETVFL